jgi:purine-nucleoside phosphorylase
MAQHDLADVRALADELAGRGATDRQIAIVLGSGLGSIADGLEERIVVPAVELEHLPRPRVAGHAGDLVLGRLSGVPVIVQRGRVHLYEGRSPFEVTRAVRAYARLGVRLLVLTNAAGGLVPDWPPGRFVRLTDHLNLQGRSALLSSEELRASPYDAPLGGLLDDAARELGIAVEHGIYAGLLGPSYETPAEIRYLRTIGADAVGMSTVPEAIVARHMGMVVLGISCITNPAAGVLPAPLDHNEVMAVAAEASEHFIALLEGILAGL